MENSIHCIWQSHGLCPPGWEVSTVVFSEWVGAPSELQTELLRAHSGKAEWFTKMVCTKEEVDNKCVLFQDWVTKKNEMWSRCISREKMVLKRKKPHLFERWRPLIGQFIFWVLAPTHFKELLNNLQDTVPSSDTPLASSSQRNAVFSEAAQDRIISPSRLFLIISDRGNQRHFCLEKMKREDEKKKNQDSLVA